MRLVMMVLVAGIVPAPVAIAQEIGNAARGEQYVRERCAGCHAVDRQTRISPVRAAPRFEALANTPGVTSMALTAWLHTSHKTMPNLIVKSPDLEDVIAWIKSLKAPATDR